MTALQLPGAPTVSKDQQPQASNKIILVHSYSFSIELAFAMDEKQHLRGSHSSFNESESLPDDRTRPRWHPPQIQYRDRALRRLCVAVCIVLLTWTFKSSVLPYLTRCMSVSQPKVIGAGAPEVIISVDNTRKVSLEAHIMSKCPDAKACLQQLVLPAMEKVNDKVDFELSFIGR
jgi:hypothetical protein